MSKSISQGGPAQAETAPGIKPVTTVGQGAKTSNKTTRPPRWVLIIGVIFVLILLLLVIMHLTSNGFGNHMQMMPNSSISRLEQFL